MITDHAIVRFLERCEGVDMDALRAAVVDEDMAAALSAIPAMWIKRGDGRRVALKNGAAVTVLPRVNHARARPGRRARRRKSTLAQAIEEMEE